MAKDKKPPPKPAPKSVTQDYGWQDVSKHDWRLLMVSFGVLALPVLGVMSYAFFATQGTRDLTDTLFLLAIPAVVIFSLLINWIEKKVYWQRFDQSAYFNAAVREDAAQMIPIVMALGLFGLKADMGVIEAVLRYIAFVGVAIAVWIVIHWLARRFTRAKKSD